MPHCGLRHSCCNARAAVRRARALELLESVHRPRMRAGLEVVPPTTGPGVVTLRKAQEFAERALGPRAPLGELKAAAVVRVRVPENLLAPQWYTFENPQRPTLLVTLSISRLANTKCCDRGWPISFFLSFLGPVGTLR